jgi:hypothetical protein
VGERESQGISARVRKGERRSLFLGNESLNPAPGDGVSPPNPLGSRQKGISQTHSHAHTQPDPFVYSTRNINMIHHNPKSPQQLPPPNRP